ncbi:hypothetical protein E2562_035597 [Oryza meyeriana var. granulata]|uniref:Uncharacterized protein n=1 Tax=Oryza meyeriana var. granulata TaxID=110450 RepID=A0A6G1ESV6_9ORYZ|nr:hypothetical protein E2562_035597 [Oryza meyeriana var. granulata]
MEQAVAREHWTLYLLEVAARSICAAYKAVLQAARRTFAGDKLMLTESSMEIRRRFEEHRGLAPGSDEAAHFITHMVVQAQRAPSGSFDRSGQLAGRSRSTKATVVKPEKVHAGATLEVPSEEILSKLK